MYINMQRLHDQRQMQMPRRRERVRREGGDLRVLPRRRVSRRGKGRR